MAKVSTRSVAKLLRTLGPVAVGNKIRYTTPMRTFTIYGDNAEAKGVWVNTVPVGRVLCEGSSYEEMRESEMAGQIRAAELLLGADFRVSSPIEAFRAVDGRIWFQKPMGGFYAHA